MKTDPRYDNDTADNVIERHRLVKQDYGPDQNQDIQNSFSQVRRRQRNQFQQKLPHDGKDSQTSHRNYIIKYKFRRKRLKLTGIFDKNRAETLKHQRQG